MQNTRPNFAAAMAALGQVFGNARHTLQMMSRRHLLLGDEGNIIPDARRSRGHGEGLSHNKHSGYRVAMAKRAAVKAKNRKRARRAAR